MILPIDEDHRIASDKHCWMIQSRRCVGAEERWEAELFYPTLNSAVNGLVELRLRASNAKGVAEALAEVERLTTSLTRALSPHFEVTSGHKSAAAK